MKKLFIVLIESFVLTVLVTFMSQAYTESNSSSDCRPRLLTVKKCINKR